MSPSVAERYVATANPVLIRFMPTDPLSNTADIPTVGSDNGYLSYTFMSPHHFIAKQKSATPVVPSISIGTAYPGIWFRYPGELAEVTPPTFRSRREKSPKML